MAQKRGCLGLLSRGPSAFFFFPTMGLLRCIVIKASQVFQSGSVAKLVLILENKTNEKERCQFSFIAQSLLKYTILI